MADEPYSFEVTYFESIPARIADEYWAAHGERREPPLQFPPDDQRSPSPGP